MGSGRFDAPPTASHNLLQMSSTSTPIPVHRFAEAITDLPLSNLHFKAAEIRNAIAHLESSNQELRRFADEGDQDCADAMKENRDVIERMKERVLLLRTEVERRGYYWGEDEVGEANGNGAEIRDAEEEAAFGADESRDGARLAGGRIGDEELARRSREQIEEDRQEGNDGVHL